MTVTTDSLNNPPTAVSLQGSQATNNQNLQPTNGTLQPTGANPDFSAGTTNQVLNSQSAVLHVGNTTEVVSTNSLLAGSAPPVKHTNYAPLLISLGLVVVVTALMSWRLLVTWRRDLTTK